MNAEQAWQSVLGLLQMEMPRASFDTWVRNTKPASYENRILTISVHNAHARDWLESRLAILRSKAEQTGRQILGENLEIIARRVKS
jgi:chromosomal replication initiator protein